VKLNLRGVWATHPTDTTVLRSGMLSGGGTVERRNSYKVRRIYNSTVAKKRCWQNPLFFSSKLAMFDQ